MTRNRPGSGTRGAAFWSAKSHISGRLPGRSVVTRPSSSIVGVRTRRRWAPTAGNSIASGYPEIVGGKQARVSRSKRASRFSCAAPPGHPELAATWAPFKALYSRSIPGTRQSSRRSTMAAVTPGRGSPVRVSVFTRFDIRPIRPLSPAGMLGIVDWARIGQRCVEGVRCGISTLWLTTGTGAVAI